MPFSPILNDQSGLEVRNSLNAQLEELFGSIGAGEQKFNVMDFGATGNTITDDHDAFQEAFDAARAVHGRVIIPPLPLGNFYRINSTINVHPIGGGFNQIWVSVEAWGVAGQIMYFGANNTACFSILGLKQRRWTGLCVAIATGRTGCVALDIDTTATYQSTSLVTFSNFYINLGGASAGATAADRNEDCIGIRTGFVSGGSGDISNYSFENINVYGGGNSGVSPNIPCPGQYAFQNLGANCLSMNWYNGFVAQCDRAYTNGNRATTDRGNASVAFYGLGGSGNNIDFVFAWEQTYLITGGRWENGNKFLRFYNGGDGPVFASIKMEGFVIHSYKQETQIEINRACSLKMDSIHIATGTFSNYTNCIHIDHSESGIGILDIRNCAFTLGSGVALPYTRSGTSGWKRTCSGNVRLNGLSSSSFFDDETNNSA